MKASGKRWVYTVKIEQWSNGTAVSFRRLGQGRKASEMTYLNLSQASCDRLDHSLWNADCESRISHVTPFTWPQSMGVQFTLIRAGETA